MALCGAQKSPLRPNSGAVGDSGSRCPTRGSDRAAQLAQLTNVPKPLQKKDLPILAEIQLRQQVVEPWGHLTCDWQIQGTGRKGDFIGLFQDDPSLGLGDYDASLLTKGQPGGSRTFIAPCEEGIFHLKLVRNDKVALACASFRVVEKHTTLPAIETAAPAEMRQPVAQAGGRVPRMKISRHDSPDNIMHLHDRQSPGSSK